MDPLPVTSVATSGIVDDRPIISLPGYQSAEASAHRGRKRHVSRAGLPIRLLIVTRGTLGKAEAYLVKLDYRVDDERRAWQALKAALAGSEIPSSA